MACINIMLPVGPVESDVEFEQLSPVNVRLHHRVTDELQGRRAFCILP